MKLIRLCAAHRLQLSYQKTVLHVRPVVLCNNGLTHHQNGFLLPRSFSISVPKSGQTPNEDTGIMKKMLRKLGFLRFTQSQLRATGYEVYANVVSSINYAKFMKELNMPDTFYSWFLITELHIWLIMARFMGENKEGRAVRNAIVEAMWQDVELRSKQLEEVASSARKEQIMILVDQFQAALFSYDEGAMSSDTVLAGALWRNLFQQSQDISLAHIEALLQYTRAQAALLDATSRDDLFLKRTVSWKPFEL